MKTMTCRQMGGPCDAKIQGSSSDEIIKKAMEHLKKEHPKMAVDVEAGSKNDPMMMAKWEKKFMADYKNTPED